MEQTVPRREDPEWVQAAARAHIHYGVAGMEEVRVRRDLVYGEAAGEALRYDLYEPLGGAGAAAAAVILIHGGPVPPNLLTTPKEWGSFDSLGRLVGASGMAAIMFNHRFFGPEAAVDAREDVERLLAHAQAHAAELGIDGGRLALWAFSGGGPFLARYLRATPEAVRCMAAYYAALDTHTPEFSATAQLGENEGRIPPLLVARAGLDLPQLNEGIDRFVVQALEMDADLDLLNHATGRHGFDGRDDNDRTREILKRTVEFLRTHLGCAGAGA